MITNLFCICDFVLDSYLVWILLASMSPAVLAWICILGVGSVVMVDIKGELPPARVILWNWKARLKRCYFEVRHWFWPRLYPRNRRKKRIKVRLRRFHRRRFVLGLVKRCRRRRSVHAPNLDGRRAPSRRSMMHRRWRERNLRSRHRSWMRRVVNHEHFLNGKRKINRYVSKSISEESLQKLCRSSDFLSPIQYLKRDGAIDHKENAQDTVDRMNACQSALRR